MPDLEIEASEKLVSITNPTKKLLHCKAQGVPIHWTELLHLPLSPQIGAHFSSPVV